MRKALLFAPMLTLLLLTACAGRGENDPVAELQAQYANLASAAMEADVTCSYEDEVRVYTMRCSYTPESSTVTVTAPANLAGISATVADGKLTLSYEDVSLDAGSYSAAAVSPVAALPNLLEAAANGYVTEKSEEELGDRQCLRLACDLKADDGALYTTWFDQETLLPLRSEISADGTVIFEGAWTNFEVTGRKADAAGTSGQPAPEEGGAEATPSDSAGQTAGAWTSAEEAAAYANAEE